MAATMSALGAANILWAERLTANGGLGWDGMTYAQLVREFYERVFIIHLPEYNLQRILPSAIVHYGMRAFGVQRTNANIISAFDFYNLLLLVMSAYVWGMIGDRLNLSVKGKWLGFVLLLLNYAILKNNFYHSVLTDTTAFALGVLMVYFYLADRASGLIAVIVAGSLSWPTIAPFAALLCAFPRSRAGRPGGDARAAGVRWNVVFAATVATSSAAAMLYLTGPRLNEVRAIFGRALRIDLPLLYLSIAATSLFLFFALRIAADDAALFDIRALWMQLSVKRAALAAFVIVVLKILLARLANGLPGWANLKLFTAYTLVSSVTEPFHFLVSHVVYYGPAILIMIMFWRPLCEAAGSLGVGVRLVLIVVILLCVNPQSRYQINVLALFVTLLVVVLERFAVDSRRIAFLVALSVAWSKVWYVMNRGPVSDDGTMDILLRFPLQHYFMNTGTWMSHPMYLFHAAAVLLSAILLYVALAGLRPREWNAPGAQ